MSSSESSYPGIHPSIRAICTDVPTYYLLYKYPSGTYSLPVTHEPDPRTPQRIYTYVPPTCDTYSLTAMCEYTAFMSMRKSMRRKVYTCVIDIAVRIGAHCAPSGIEKSPNAKRD
jgi:hypothetical protein